MNLPFVRSEKNLIIKNKGHLLNKIEKDIILYLNKDFPEFFKKITKLEIKNIKNKIKTKYNKIISSSIIKSIKSLYTKDYIIKNTHKINRIKNIIEKYKKQDILEICKEHRISPLNILRFIYKKLYNKKLVHNEKNYLTEYDKKQLKIACKNDFYSPLQDMAIKKACEFETLIEELLINNNIFFKTQETLVKEQIKEFGRPINTPDFLILSNLYINNIKINWIDAKNFYGANINFIRKKIKEQETRYYNKFGSGCIIYSLGFNKKLEQKNIIYISYKKFKKIINNYI